MYKVPIGHWVLNRIFILYDLKNKLVALSTRSVVHTAPLISLFGGLNNVI